MLGEERLRLLAGFEQRLLLLLVEAASKFFFDISTGSYMNQSALSPGAVTHFTCS